MIISIKDSFKLIGVAVMTCCAVLVCNLFVNYLIDVSAIEDSIVDVSMIALYNAQVATAKVVCAVSGGCLIITTVITLFFYIGRYVERRARDIGILKAMGYTDIQIASRFAIFGLSALLGCAVGYALSYALMPVFYAAQSKDMISLSFSFNPITLLIILLPPIVFSALAILWAYRKMRLPVVDLLKERRNVKVKIRSRNKLCKSFLMQLALNSLACNKGLVFFMAFSSFCFSSMTQMSISMTDISGVMFSVMILVIGLTLAFMTLLMSLSSVVKNHARDIAVMNACGWNYTDCSRALIGAYRPVAWLGFAVGSGYQYGLLKIAVEVIFKSVESVNQFNFDWAALAISAASFALVYESILYVYRIKLKRATLKSIVGSDA